MNEISDRPNVVDEYTEGQHVAVDGGETPVVYQIGHSNIREASLTNVCPNHLALVIGYKTANTDK